MGAATNEQVASWKEVSGCQGAKMLLVSLSCLHETSLFFPPFTLSVFELKFSVKKKNADNTVI